ncbi:MAG: helix-turn-helix domain-containing protein [Phycisphaeraceae bacterium]
MTIKDIPKTWDSLVRLYPLRPVHDEVDRENVTEIIDAMAGHDLTPDQDDYLDAISTLLDAYESEHHAVETPDVSGLDVLRSLMDDHGISAAELGRLLDVHRSHAAKIVRGERSLTVDHLRRLSGHFKVRPDVFIDP